MEVLAFQYIYPCNLGITRATLRMPSAWFVPPQYSWVFFLHLWEQTALKTLLISISARIRCLLSEGEFQ